MLIRKQENSVFSWKDVLSCRNEIFGFTAVWIILFHLNDFIGLSNFRGWLHVRSVFVVGNCGVDIFLFLSAIGLYRSMEKHTLRDFYRNRVLRICLPYLLAAVPYFLWYDFVFAKDGIWQFLTNVSTINYWLAPKYPIWYVSFIVVLYALFPLIYRADVKSRHASTVALIAFFVILEYVLLITDSVIYKNAERALSRMPVFLLGVVLASRILQGRTIPLYQVMAAFLAGLGVFRLVTTVSMHLVLVRYLYCILAVSIILVYAYFRKHIRLEWGYRLLRWLGQISFEIYAVHVLLVKGINHCQLWDKIGSIGVWYILILVSSIAAAKLVAVLAGRMNGILGRIMR